MLQLLQSLQIAAGVRQVYQFKEFTANLRGFLGNLLLHCEGVRGDSVGERGRGVGVQMCHVR